MKPSVLLTAAHWAMALTFSISLVILYFLYCRPTDVSILTSVLLHIAFIIAAVILKISYVARLAALKSLGRPAHNSRVNDSKVRDRCKVVLRYEASLPYS